MQKGHNALAIKREMKLAIWFILRVGMDEMNKLTVGGKQQTLSEQIYI